MYSLCHPLCEPAIFFPRRFFLPHGSCSLFSHAVRGLLPPDPMVQSHAHLALCKGQPSSLAFDPSTVSTDVVLDATRPYPVRHTDFCRPLNSNHASPTATHSAKYDRCLMLSDAPSLLSPLLIIISFLRSSYRVSLTILLSHRRSSHTRRSITSCLHS